MSNGPILYYSFENVSGSTVIDSGSGGNNGTMVNSPTITTGKMGKAVSLNGSNQSITVGTISLSTITISTWIYANSSSGNIIVEKAPVNSEWLLMFEGGYVVWRGSDTSHDLRLTAPSTGAWHHIAATFDGTTAIVYIDGVAVGSNSRPAHTNGTGAIYIGGGVDFSAYYFNGVVDEVYIFDRALSQAEIIGLYNLPSSRSAIGFM